MVESGSLVVLPLTNVAELRREKFYLKARKRYLEIAEWETVGYMRGKMIAVVLRMACSRLELEEGAHHKYLGRAKVPAEALASLVAEDCSVAAAAAAVAVVVVVAPVVAAAAAADVAAGLVVVAEPVAAAAVELVAVEARELGDFVAGHQNHQTLRWEMGGG
jgi:hypothetical protein